MIPVVAGTLGTVPKALEKRLEEMERKKQYHIDHIIGRIIGRPKEIHGHSVSNEKPLVNPGKKCLPGVK